MPTKSEEGYLVRLSENALIALVLNSLEAYSIHHKNIHKSHDRVKLETYGNLFGYETRLTDGRTAYQIEIANTDTSVKNSNGSVSYNVAAIELKIDTVTSFWPHLDYLGDFHSHPYDDYETVRRIKGYYFSEGDRTDLSIHSDFWSKHRHRVGILLAIGPMKRAGRRATQWINSNLNCVEINLGNFKLWITAYCSYENDSELQFSDDNDPLVMLECPSLTGLVWEHTKFGRIKLNGGNVKFEPSHKKKKSV